MFVLFTVYTALRVPLRSRLPNSRSLLIRIHSQASDGIRPEAKTEIKSKPPKFYRRKRYSFHFVLSFEDPAEENYQNFLSIQLHTGCATCDYNEGRLRADVKIQMISVADSKLLACIKKEESTSHEIEAETLVRLNFPVLICSGVRFVFLTVGAHLVPGHEKNIFEYFSSSSKRGVIFLVVKTRSYRKRIEVNLFSCPSSSRLLLGIN